MAWHSEAPKVSPKISNRIVKYSLAGLLNLDNSPKDRVSKTLNTLAAVRACNRAIRLAARYPAAVNVKISQVGL